MYREAAAEQAMYHLVKKQSDDSKQHHIQKPNINIRIISDKHLPERPVQIKQIQTLEHSR